MQAAMTPLLGQYWSAGGKKVRERIGLDPDEWRVTDPHLKEMIEAAAFDFVHATNQTTSLKLDTALARLREQLTAGLVEEGDSLAQLTKRVQSVFDKATTSRARRIAATEAARAVHAAQEQSAIESGVVAGWEWLVSEDACPLCLQIAAEVASVPLGGKFAEIGNHPLYQHIGFPPAHPNCQCTVLEVLLPEYGGPEDPEWGEPLIQPKPPADYVPPTPVKPEPEKLKPTPVPEPKPKPKPAPPPPPPPPPPRAFPDDAEADVELVKRLGGSTGAELVRDKVTGRLFVRKRGSNPGHLLEEAAADAIYRAAGVDVPGSRIYQTAGGPVKLAEFVEGKTLGDWIGGASWSEVGEVKQKLREGFALDALLGNWDVVGMGQDNILVAADGRVLRIDNGGSLRYRAQGALKAKAQWGGDVKELESLRNPSINPSAANIFSALSDDDVRKQIAALAKNRQAILDAAPPELREVLGTRLDSMVAWGKPRPRPALGNWAPRPESEFRNLDAEDGHQWGQSTYAPWVASLTADERRAIRSYTGSSYRTMNDRARAGLIQARGKGSKLDEQIHLVDSALEKGRTTEPLVVFRGAYLTRIGIDAAKLQYGDVIPDRGFSSSAIARHKAWSGDGLEIRIPPGTPAGYMDTGPPGDENKYISSNAGERELLLGRRVVGFRFIERRSEVDQRGHRREWLVVEAVVEENP